MGSSGPLLPNYSSPILMQFSTRVALALNRQVQNICAVSVVISKLQIFCLGSIGKQLTFT